jgi:hypothetical protein
MIRTSIALSSGIVIQASNGTFGAMGDEVFKITKWANNITINGDGMHNAVFDFASGITPNLDNGSSTGHNADSLAFIEISNKSTPFASGAQIYVQGEVTTGEKIFAGATLNQLTNTPVAAPNNVFSTMPGAGIYMYLFNSQSDFQNHVALIQSELYNTSGSQAMHFNDQIGSLKVIGYIGALGRPPGLLAVPSPPSRARRYNPRAGGDGWRRTQRTGIRSSTSSIATSARAVARR